MSDSNPQPGPYEKPRFSPGCFGSPTAYKMDEVCRSCDFFAQCGPVSRQTKIEFDLYYSGSDYETLLASQNRDALRMRKKRAKIGGQATYSIDPVQSRADLSGMTEEERAAHKREQARLRKAKSRAKKATSAP